MAGERKPPEYLTTKSDSANCRTCAGAELRCASAFYMSRNPPTVVQKHDRATRQLLCRGKINTTFAFCVDAGETNEALEGEIIGYTARSISGPFLWRRTKSHRANWGMLEGDVFCRLMSPFRNRPQQKHP